MSNQNTWTIDQLIAAARWWLEPVRAQTEEVYLRHTMRLKTLGARDVLTEAERISLDSSRGYFETRKNWVPLNNEQFGAMAEDLAYAIYDVANERINHSNKVWIAPDGITVAGATPTRMTLSSDYGASGILREALERAGIVRAFFPHRRASDTHLLPMSSKVQMDLYGDGRVQVYGSGIEGKQLLSYEASGILRGPESPDQPDVETRLRRL